MIKIISIITEWNQTIGSGHIQRMMNIAGLINSKTDFKAYIINQKKHIDTCREFDYILLNEIHPDTSLIIRDMRDSSKSEIEELKRKAPVLVIDDLGQGAISADFKINILPDIYSKKHDLKKFLYGYNFSESIKSLSTSEIINKEIDIAFYTGYKPEEKYISAILELFPYNSTAAVLSGENSFLFSKGEKKSFNIEYSEALLKSRIVLSHFGLTIYEGFACGAVPLTINPTEYHRTLTKIVQKEMGIIDIGLFSELDKKIASEIIKNSLSDIKAENISSEKVLNKIESASNNFYEYLLNITQ